MSLARGPPSLYAPPAMIPLRDRNPSGAFPLITLSLILVNTFVFLYELQLGPALGKFLLHYALVPAHVTGSLQYGALSLPDTVAPFFTSMFLHGGWLHLIMNMWFLWIFGDNVEDTLGAFRYNTISTAEHAFSLLLSAARKIPQAD